MENNDTAIVKANPKEAVAYDNIERCDPRLSRIRAALILQRFCECIFGAAPALSQHKPLIESICKKLDDKAREDKLDQLISDLVNEFGTGDGRYNIPALAHALRVRAVHVNSWPSDYES